MNEEITEVSNSVPEPPVEDIKICLKNKSGEMVLSFLCNKEDLVSQLNSSTEEVVFNIPSDFVIYVIQEKKPWWKIW
jgi:hypothetical protein